MHGDRDEGGREVHARGERPGVRGAAEYEGRDRGEDREGRRRRSLPLEPSKRLEDLRRSASGRPAISSLTSLPVPMKKKMTIDWENSDKSTVGMA